MDFSKIRDYRKAAHVTQEELAKALGINRATLSKYENGQITPPLEQINNIAVLLNVRLTDLLPPELSEKFFKLEDVAYDVKDFIIEHAYDFEEYKSAHDTPIPEIQYSLLCSEIERNQMEKIEKAFKELNEAGKLKAVERIEELTEIPKFQREYHAGPILLPIPAQPPQAPTPQDNETTPEDE